MDPQNDWPDVEPVRPLPVRPGTKPVDNAATQRAALGVPAGWPVVEIMDPKPEPDVAGTVQLPERKNGQKTDTSIVDGILQAAYGDGNVTVSMSGRAAGKTVKWKPAPTGVLAVLYLLHAGASFILLAMGGRHLGKLQHNLGVLAHGGSDVVDRAANASSTGWFAFACLTLIALHVTACVGLGRGSVTGLNVTRAVFGIWCLFAGSVISQSLEGNSGIPMIQLVSALVLAAAGIGLTFTTRISDWCDRRLSP